MAIGGALDREFGLRRVDVGPASATPLRRISSTKTFSFSD
jgi:hypothetical protein